MPNTIVDQMQAVLGKELPNHPSAVTRWLKIILTKFQEGVVEAEFNVNEDHLNPIGTLHGGVIAALMDDIIGAAVYSLNTDNAHAALNINVDFLAAGKLGDKMTAIATVRKKGRQVVTVDCELRNATNKLCAIGRSNLFQLSRPVGTRGKTD